MTDTYFEAMETYGNCVYIGEDVRHGGKYKSN